MTLVFALPASAGVQRVTVTDDHPTGGGGATGKSLTFNWGDPSHKVEYSKACGNFYLAGFAFGHEDPHIKDPKAVCGHGIIFFIPTGGNGNTGPQPLSILPIEAPMPIEPGQASAADAAKLIREMLPRLDKTDGDNMPIVIQMRDSIRRIDVLNGTKFMPKRQPTVREQG